MTDRLRAAQFGIALLAVAACVNLAASVTISLGDARRASDLWTVYGWCRAWLIDGQSLYAGSDASADYPPNAIVLLSPLALVPQRWLVPLWTAVAVALTPVLPWLVMRSASRRGRVELAVPVLLFLCWAAPRTVLQFSLLSMLLAWSALLIADTRWIASGVALGLALFKPHVAGPIALWMIVTGRFRHLAIAAGVVLAGWAIYDARIGESPLNTAAGYGRALDSQYGGPNGLVGNTSIRGLTRLAMDPASADALWIVLAALLLIAVCWLAMRDRSCALNEGGLAVPAMFCLWSLLVTYHNGNNLILMLPAFAFLWFHGDRRSVWHWIPLAVLQAALSFDVPIRLSHVAPRLGWGRLAIEHFDRVLVLVTLAYVCALWYRLTAARSS